MQFRLDLALDARCDSSTVAATRPQDPPYACFDRHWRPFLPFDRPGIVLPLGFTRRYLRRICLERRDMSAYHVAPQIVAHHLSTGPRAVFQQALMA